MAYQTLYRKYRPNSFELVYGQDVIVKTLKNVIKNDKLSHAYLFTGPRGTGKTSCAKLFAKAINCLSPKDGDACNNCANCKSFNENSNPDIIEMDAASNNGVDEIREIKSKVNLVPSMSKYKVYIIDEVHMLSIGAFNALLKTLEEPPEYVIFILATTDPQKVPATIISRCQRFDFKSISPDKMKLCLQNIVKNEKIKIDDNALDEIISNSKGGMRDAIGMLDQASAFTEDKITKQDVEELSGNISDEELNNLFNNIISKNYEIVFDKIGNYSSLGKDFTIICEKMINYIRKGILYKKNIEQRDITDIDKNFYDSLSDGELYKIIDYISESLIKIRNNFQKELTFEVQIIGLMDKINNNKREESNVPRETLSKKEPKEVKTEEKDTDVSRETSYKNNKGKVTNVPRETLEENETLTKIKDIRINNILMNATKKDLNFINEMWENVENYLIDEKYKLVAGILKDAKPVAASSKGIIITLPLDSIVNRVEKEYDISKELLKDIYNDSFKIVYISDDYWHKVRPEYIEKIKNKTISLIDEEEILNELKEKNNKTSVNEFSDLIEMEEK